MGGELPVLNALQDRLGLAVVAFANVRDAQGHGVVVQDPCAARLRDAFIEDPEPKRALPCRADTPPNFTAAYERARNLP